MHSPFVWPKRSNPEIASLNWTYVLVGTADGTLLPFIPLLLVQRGMNASVIGLVLATAAAASLVVGLAWAYLADRRFSPERMVVAAGATAAAVALLLILARGDAFLALVIVGLSIARSPLMLLDPIVLRKLRVTPRSDYARIRLRMSAGWAASSIASGTLFQASGLRLIPFIYAPLSALVGFWVWRTLKPAALADAEQAPAAKPSVRVRRIPVPLLTFLASLFLLGASLAATQNFLVLQIDLLGGGALLIGAAAAFQAVTEIPAMGYIHVLTRYLSHRFLFAIGCAIYLVIFVAWAFVSDPLVAALLKLVVGVAFAFTYVAAVTIANDLAPARLRATGQALMKAVLFGLAPILGSLVGGIVYDRLGPRVMFLGATAVVGLAGLVALLAVPARERQTQQPATVPVPVPELEPSQAAAGKAARP